jgi:hypothetical protein
MAYTGVEELKTYLGITVTTDDALLRDLLEWVSGNIDTYTGRRFESVTATRYYESDALAEDRYTLWMDDDLLTITTLTNGDDDGTAIPSTEYWLLPRNSSPKYGIRLKSDSTYAWEWDVDGWVSVAGTWGFSASPPEAVVRATLEWAAYAYRLKDGGGPTEVMIFPEAGFIQVPRGMPIQVKLALDPYVRLVTWPL